jgi:hypothetical protein
MFTGIIGDMGSGKTNLLTRYLKQASDAGGLVIANYHLKFRHRLMPFSELAKLGPEIENADIGMDELGVGADSYDFLSKDVRAITTLATQLRKRNCRVYYTVQRYSMIARRIRIQTPNFIVMDDPDKHNLIRPDGTKASRHREVCTGRFIAQYMDDYMLPVGRPKVFDGRPYWGLYDTDEIIWSASDMATVGKALSGKR